jgi:hypothetical protein
MDPSSIVPWVPLVPRAKGESLWCGNRRRPWPRRVRGKWDPSQSPPPFCEGGDRRGREEGLSTNTLVAE